jgi:hypothetical protein
MTTRVKRGLLGLNHLLVVLCAFAIATGPAAGAVEPQALATTGGNGTASVTGGPWDGWRIVVTTRPSGLAVGVKIGGGKTLITKSPFARSGHCRPRCTIRVTARLSRSSGKPSTGTISLALYRQSS